MSNHHERGPYRVRLKGTAWTMPSGDTPQRCTVFDGPRQIASGSIEAVTRAVGARSAMGEDVPLCAFDDLTGQPIPLTLTQRTRGRPRLGVEARAVMLLPRQWDWLAAQPGGASAAIRMLVEQAWMDEVRSAPGLHAARAVRRFVEALGLQLDGVEAACEALRDGRLDDAERRMADWPGDVRRYALKLARVDGVPGA